MEYPTDLRQVGDLPQFIRSGVSSNDLQ